MKKKCATCKADKDRSEFHKNRNCRDGLEYDCKECRKKKHEYHRKEKKENDDNFYNTFL